MHSLRHPTRLAVSGALIAILVAGGMFAASRAVAEDAPASGPRMFDSAVDAARALVEAAEKNDTAAIVAIFGRASAAHVQQGDDPVVKKERADFAAAAKAQSRLEPNEDGSQTLVVGENEWPLPFPLRSKDGKFWWDGPAGVEEMRMRRIGRNELRVIDMMRVYVDAQIEYASVDRDGDGVREYARQIRSSEGAHDGLFWPTAEGETPSPLGPLVASWREHLTPGRAPGSVPFGGYYYRILTGQGAAAPGGRHGYVINGNMIAGFALVAYPAVYGESGVMTFMVSHHGTIVQRDLGRCTAQCVRQMRGFNPVPGWTAVTGD